MTTETSTRPPVLSLATKNHIDNHVKLIFAQGMDGTVYFNRSADGTTSTYLTLDQLREIRDWANRVVGESITTDIPIDRLISLGSKSGSVRINSDGSLSLFPRVGDAVGGVAPRNLSAFLGALERHMNYHIGYVRAYGTSVSIGDSELILFADSRSARTRLIEVTKRAISYTSNQPEEPQPAPDEAAPSTEPNTNEMGRLRVRVASLEKRVQEKVEWSDLRAEATYDAFDAFDRLSKRVSTLDKRLTRVEERLGELQSPASD